jgi:hypothetical protein
MSFRSARSILAVAAVSMLATAGIAPAAMARNGADDPPGHNVGDNHGARGHGADDGPNHR